MEELDYDRIEAIKRQIDEREKLGREGITLELELVSVLLKEFIKLRSRVEDLERWNEADPFQD